ARSIPVSRRPAPTIGTVSAIASNENLVHPANTSADLGGVIVEADRMDQFQRMGQMIDRRFDV
ncbi:MAG TPA: hypothetical protein VEF90_01145, partial [Xanthobacteraceae bacterium]|nr:hypothetical protein [Xanthobacteraceae bacterium]